MPKFEVWHPVFRPLMGVPMACKLHRSRGWDNTVRMVDVKAVQISAVFTKRSRFKMLHRIQHLLRLHAEAVS